MSAKYDGNDIYHESNLCSYPMLVESSNFTFEHKFYNFWFFSVKETWLSDKESAVG